MRKHIIWSFSSEFIQESLNNSNSYIELFNKLNLKVSKSLIKMLQYRIKKENLDREIFLLNTKKKTFSFEKKIEDILIENSTYLSSSNLKKKLLKYELIENKCDKCGCNNEWFGNILVLQLDHINGVNNDNRLENLRLLCPNCHSQTETYAGKKKKEIKNENNLKLCKKCKSIVNNKVFCEKCDSEMKIKRRKVNRPEYDILIKEVGEMGYSATGRKYGVSDNSIRKWIKI